MTISSENFFTDLYSQEIPPRLVTCMSPTDENNVQVLPACVIF